MGDDPWGIAGRAAFGAAEPLGRVIFLTAWAWRMTAEARQTESRTETRIMVSAQGI
jgi:hypothetical protein